MNHIDPAAPVIFWGTLLLFFGIFGRYLAQRAHQPGVLGELLMGVLVGNVGYWLGMHLMLVLREGPALFDITHKLLSGLSLEAAVREVIPNLEDAKRLVQALSGPQGVDWIKVSYVVDVFSRYGVIFLLFMVGLENSFSELKQTGRAAAQVAVIGVVAPILLGFLAIYFLLPQASIQSDLFVAATLCATSVGITARVLKDMKKLRTREAKTILGAAMIDDILGLIILAIVSGIVAQHVFNVFLVSQMVAMAILFFVLALLLGPWVLRKMVQAMEFLDPWEAKLFTAFLFVMALAWLAAWLHLSTIIGAFVAGMIIHDGFFQKREKTTLQPMSIKNLVSPLESIFAPLFFMLIGIQVKLETFNHWQVWMMALLLFLAAVLGKLCCGLGASKRDDRLLIGLGMMPRGEVGLVFAVIGKSTQVISDQLFTAIILMVVLTTLLTPPLLKARFANNRGSHEME